MTKAEHKKLITIEKCGSFKKAYYLDIFCGTYVKGFTDREIKDDVYSELKRRGMLN